MSRRLVALMICCVGAAATPAWAEYKVRSPEVEGGEWGLESVGDVGSDKNPDKNNAKSTVFELEYGVTDWWKTELEGDWGRDPGPGDAEHYQATTWGNQFQFFPQGSHWLDAALWAEYGRSYKSADADSITFGPILQKTLGDFTATANLYLETQVGAHAVGGSDASYAAQVKYDWLRWLDPAVEVYGDWGKINHFTQPHDQLTLAGPVLLGQVGLRGFGEIKYEIGYLAGVSTTSPASTVKWKLEYEIAF